MPHLAYVEIRHGRIEKAWRGTNMSKGVACSEKRETSFRTPMPHPSSSCRHYTSKRTMSAPTTPTIPQDSFEGIVF